MLHDVYADLEGLHSFIREKELHQPGIKSVSVAQREALFRLNVRAVSYGAAHWYL